MYQPAHFREQHGQHLFDLIEQNPLATIVTLDNGLPNVNHIPLLLERASPVRLIGHFARANPQWRQLQHGDPTTLVFQGPHAYISPSWYRAPGVPTWNYTAVHVRARTRIVEQAADVADIITRLTRHFERLLPSPWQPAYTQAQLHAVVGVVFEIEQLQGKFKLNQNRSYEDRNSVMEHLSASGRQDHQALLELMQRDNATVSHATQNPSTDREQS